jgi:hypothetical protein
MYLAFVPVAQWEHQLQCGVGNLYKLLKTPTERSETKCKVLSHFALKLLQDLLPEQMLRRMCISCVNTWHKCEKMLQRDIITTNLLLIDGVWFYLWTLRTSFVLQGTKHSYISTFWTKCLLKYVINKKRKFVSGSRIQRVYS